MTSSELTAADQRGRVTIAPRVVEKICLQATREVRGTTEERSVVNRLTRRAVPSAEVKVSGDRAVVSVDVGARWGESLVEVTDAVRTRITARLLSLAGVTSERVDVTVSVIGSVDRRPKVTVE